MVRASMMLIAQTTLLPIPFPYQCLTGMPLVSLSRNCPLFPSAPFFPFLRPSLKVFHDERPEHPHHQPQHPGDGNVHLPPVRLYRDYWRCGRTKNPCLEPSRYAWRRGRTNNLCLESSRYACLLCRRNILGYRSLELLDSIPLPT